MNDEEKEQLAKGVQILNDISKLPKCKHHFLRKTATNIECIKCRFNLIDLGKFKIVDGEISV